MTTPIHLDIPLLNQLYALNEVASSRFPYEYGSAFGTVGLNLFSPLLLDFYPHITPRNVATFGQTGGGGTHFSLLRIEGRIDAASPVVVTANCCNVILAENLTDFIRLGLVRGYFSMEAFTDGHDVAVEAYGNPNWQPPENYLHGGVPDDNQRQILEFIANSLNLQPLLCTPKTFQELQDRYLHFLEISPKSLG